MTPTSTMVNPNIRNVRPATLDPMGESLPVAVYLRVSSDEQRENETIKTQRGVIEQFLRLRPELRVVEWYIDDGVSGTIPLHRRPAGKRLVEDTEAGHFKKVLVARADRLGRDLGDLLSVRDFFSGLAVELVGIAEPLGDELNFDILAVLAKHERKRFLARSKEGMDRAAREGRYTGGIVAYGLRAEGEKHNAHLVLDTQPLWGDLSASDIVRRMYHRAAVDGWSCQGIANELNDLGIPTHYRRDGRGYRNRATRAFWRASRIRNMLVQPVYKGELAYGRRSGTHREVIVASTPAVVSAEMWQAAQETLGRNRVISSRQTAVYLLRGLIRCQLCGLTYHGTYGRDGQRYSCGGKQRDRGKAEGRCLSRSIAARDIEPLILADLRQYCLTPNDILDELVTDTPDGTDIREAERPPLVARLRELDEQAARAKRLAVRGTLSDDELDQELVEVANGRRTIEARLATLAAAQPVEQPIATDLPERLRARIDEMTPEEWRDVAPLLINGITADTSFDDSGHKSLRLTITYNFAKPTDEDNRQSRDDTGTDS